MLPIRSATKRLASGSLPEKTAPLSVEERSKKWGLLSMSWGWLVRFSCLPSIVLHGETSRNGRRRSLRAPPVLFLAARFHHASARLIFVPVLVWGILTTGHPPP